MRLVNRSMTLALLIAAGAVLQTGCGGDSPVPDDETVYLRGDAAPEISLVKMVNFLGFAGRTASVNEDGRYEFAWTGADLTGFFGERDFFLRAPASAGSEDARTTSELFHLRHDMEAPYLALWDSELTAQVIFGEDLEIGFTVPSGEEYQPIESYEVVVRYQALWVDEDGSTSIVSDTAWISIPAGGGTITASQLAAELPDRVGMDLQVSVKAEGFGQPLDLTYHSHAVQVFLPLPTE